MVMWQDLNGGRCSMGDACSNPPDADGVHKMLMKNFDRHFTSNRYLLLTLTGLIIFNVLLTINLSMMSKISCKEAFLKCLS